MNRRVHACHFGDKIVLWALDFIELMCYYEATYPVSQAQEEPHAPSNRTR